MHVKLSLTQARGKKGVPPKKHSRNIRARLLSFCKPQLGCTQTKKKKREKPSNFFFS